MLVRIYRFGGFTLDCDRFELLRGNQSLKLERKPMELLILLAAKNGHLVTRAEISERLWDQEIYVDTEHGINTAVRKIRQVLKDDSEQPRFVQTVTGKGYRFVGKIEQEIAGTEPLISMIPAPPNSREAEIPDLEQAQIPAPQTEPSRPVPIPGPRLWPWAGVLAASILAALLLYPEVRGGRGESPAIHSLAVLPLENLTGVPGQDYVVDGLTDELTTMLAKNSTLRITSRTSVMQYKGVHRPLPEIARALGVDGILEGSISRSGDNVHMTIQLIHAPNDTHVWAESYDRNVNGLVSLPREAAQAIAKRLNSSVAQPATVRYVSPEAHDAYLRGRYLWFTDHTQEAGPYFKRATELQPDYALGWSGLAIYYGASAVKGELSPTDSFTGMEAASQRALALDDSLAEAHLAAAGTEMEVHWNLARAEAETLRATELDPKFAEAYHLQAKILAAMGRHPEAIEAQRKATEIDPFTRPWAMALALMEARQFDAALKDASEKSVAFPNDTILLGLIHVIYERKGMQPESVAALEKSLLSEGRQETAHHLRQAFSQGGYRAVLQWQLEGLTQRSKTSYVTPVELASFTARLGEREETLKLLEEAYRQRATGLLWMQDDPAFDFLHKEERYQAIVRRIGLPAA